MRPNVDDDSRRHFLRALTALGGAGLGGGFLLSACGGTADQAESTDGNRASAVQQINEIRREWERAENQGDPSIIDRYAAADVVAMPPGNPPIVGADASKNFLREWFSRFDVEVEYTSEEIVVSGDLAFDHGTAFQRMVPKGEGDPIEGTHSYLWVYRRTEQEWKQIRAIWNKNG